NFEDQVIYLIALILYRVIMHKSEGRPPENNTHQHQQQRNMQVKRHRGINLRKTHKEDNHYQDQPHVIGFPDRPDSVGGGLTVLSARKEFENSCPEIGTCKKHIENDRKTQKKYDEI